VKAPAWGAPPWRVDVAPARVPPPSRCDVAVIGGGFTGLSSAYHLARRGARVAVLEAATLGAGASGRTGGIVLEGTAAGPLEGVERCLEAMAGVVETAAIDCDLRLPGCLELEHRAQPGRLGPFWRDGETWLCVSDTVSGGTVDPGALVTGLARAAAEAGATLHEHAAVAAVEASRLVEVHSEQGTVLADQVVLALNAYTSTLLDLPVRLDAALTLGVCTAPLEPAAGAALGLVGGLPFYTIDLPYLWGRPLRDGRLVLGAGLVMAGGRLISNVALEPEGSPSLARLADRIRGFHPALRDLTLRDRWGGPIAFTSTRKPVLGRMPGSPRIVVTGGCAGHGIALGVRMGQLVAAAVLDGEPLPAWGALRAGPAG
jgi:gamma-glutamylputrescine oxidase